MKSCFKVLAAFLFMFLFGDVVMAQCPGQKTVFIWVNGILVPSSNEWDQTVASIRTNFLSAHSNLNPDCVKFDAVYNQSAWLGPDVGQSAAQLVSIALAHINFSDPDFITLLDKIGGYSFQGYKVVLVGHSQGSLYTNIAYDAIKNGEAQIYVPIITSLPDESKLSIVNIATPANYVPDGKGRYTTQCGDFVVAVGFPANILNDLCSGPFVLSMHYLGSYLADGSETQTQIYHHLEDSLPVIPPPPPLTATCYANPSVITAGQSTVFTGDSIGGSTGVITSNWVGVVSGSGTVKTYTTTSSTPAGFGNATYTVSDSSNQTATANCQVQINPPPPPPDFTLTPASTSLYIMQGSSGTANITLASQGGLSGNATIALYCSSTSCPSGFSYSFTRGTFNLPANGSIPISATFFPSSAAMPGVYNYEYRVTVGNVTKISTISVTVNSPTPTTGTIIVTVNPDANTTHQATNCSINNTGGFSVTYGPVIFNGQTPGSKSIVCTFTPSIWMLDSIVPSTTQNLSAGQVITFTVNLKLSPVPPTPVLSSIQVNSEPTVNRAINVSLFGANFFGGSQGYVCTTPSTNSCVATDTSFFTSTQVRFTNVRSSFPTTLYLRVSNTSGVFSNYMSMVVIP